MPSEQFLRRIHMRRMLVFPSDRNCEIVCAAVRLESLSNVCSGVMEDLEAWWPKIKPGGIMVSVWASVGQN